MDKQNAIQQILQYHEQTKHQPDRYAIVPGQMDGYYSAVDKTIYP